MIQVQWKIKARKRRNRNPGSSPRGANEGGESVVTVAEVRVVVVVARRNKIFALVSDQS